MMRSYLFVTVLALELLLPDRPYAQQVAINDAELMFNLRHERDEFQQLYDQKQFEKALAVLQGLYANPQFERFEVERINTLYDLSRVHSRLGHKEEAINCLRVAMDAGFRDYDRITKDADLDTIRSDSRFTSLLEEIKSRNDFWAGVALATPYRENVGDDEKIAGLSRFWSEVKYNFVNRKRLLELNWDAIYLSYLPKVRETKSTLEYLKVLRQMCALLKDGHTSVYANAKELAAEMYSRPLIRTRLIEDKVLVVRVYDEQLKTGGFEPGVEVLKIDGIQVRQFAEERVFPYVTAATMQDQEVRTFDYELLQGSDKVPIKLTLRDAKGNVFERTLARLSPEDQTKFFAKSSPSTPLQLKVLEGNIGYVPLNSFGDRKLVKEFDDIFPAIEKTSALIIDVRNNGGGSSGIGWDILAYLTDRPFAIQTWRTTEYHPTFRAWGYGPQTYTEPENAYAPKAGRFYAKPVVVLTSARTYSAAEDFCVAFDYMKRGTMIGETTGGSTGQPLLFKLPGGLGARVRTKHDTYPDGKEFIDVGIQPNLVVHPTVADVRADRDTVLLAAIRYLTEKLGK